MSSVQACGSLRIALLIAVVSGCAGGPRLGVKLAVPIPSSVLMESRTIDNAVQSRPGLLTKEAFESIAGSVRALRADPSELFILVGDTIRIANEVRILALDSAGTVLGELPYYDFAYQGRGFFLLADGRARLNRVGTVVFTARLPTRHWRGTESTRPTTIVSLVVRRDAWP
jgi:hypothetical protein